MYFDMTTFETERFRVVLLPSREGRRVAENFLQEKNILEQLPWLNEKIWDAAMRETYGLSLHAPREEIMVWEIMALRLETIVGTILARNAGGKMDVEVLVGDSQYWNNGVADEVSPCVVEWMEENSDMTEHLPIQMH